MKQFKTPLFITGVSALFLLVFLWGLNYRAAYLEASRQLRVKEDLLTELKNIDTAKEKQTVTAKEVIDLVRELNNKPNIPLQENIKTLVASYILEASPSVTAGITPEITPPL